MNDQPPEPLSPTPAPVNNIAGRDKRFLAAMLDGVLAMTVSFPVFTHFGFWEAVKHNTEISPNVMHGLTLFSLLVFFVLHGYFLYQYGQTVGKRIMGLAIVTLDGAKPPFAALIVSRYLPQWIVGIIPVLGPLLAMGNLVYIFFNDQNQCLHDLIAKTKVIDLSVKVAAARNTMLA